MKHYRLTILMAAALALLGLAACSSDDPATPAAADLATAEKDAAATIAADLSSDQGGLLDQLGDAVLFAGGFDPALKFDREPPADCEGLRDAVYDSASGTWTITIDRERGDPEGVPYHAFSSVFTVRFLDADGDAQMHYLSEDSVAASTIEYAILEGTGVHRTRRGERELLSLVASFVITDADSEFVTVNGTYARSAAANHVNPRFERTHESTLQLELIDVVAPRGAGRDLAQAVSGTVTGTYDALITVTRGDDYLEREIHREFTITLGDGECLMDMNHHRYRARLHDGELIEE
jgi:hypothetical protein